MTAMPLGYGAGVSQVWTRNPPPGSHAKEAWPLTGPLEAEISMAQVPTSGVSGSRVAFRAGCIILSLRSCGIVHDDAPSLSAILACTSCTASVHHLDAVR